ncbi:MAG: PilN domain-containing protein [Pseudomonadales bacterium]|nr:PilN domain-containing protein [Pseudomonadales bacterium]MCP5329469.1 PilN domain-containing protein [Pseudomonadales bacterium]MCP5344965.1 PilN domain-containing protein [Pseudomonadales bacterium]
MARINLLPWREQLREERKREFFVLLLGVVIIAAGILFLVDRSFRNDIRYQQGRNDFLRREIMVLDARIAEINQLKEQKQQINSRMEVIQGLQGSRPVIVRIFDELVKTLPSGVYFNTLTRVENRLEIEGIAESNNKVSELMRRLDDSPWFSSPSLQQISAASADANSEQRVANAFSLTLMLDEPAREEEAN